MQTCVTSSALTLRNFKKWNTCKRHHQWSTVINKEAVKKPKQIELEGPPKQNFNPWIPKANILIILDAKRGC